MKYGKEFQHILQDSHFPEEWKTSAIEYNKLKKLIKDVVSELSAMGLSPDVLNKLLVTSETDTKALSSSSTAVPSDATVRPPVHPSSEQEDVLEFEFESDEASPPTLANGSTPPLPPARPYRPIAKEVLIDPILDEDGSETEDLAAAGPSSLPHGHHRKFRLRLLSEPELAPLRPKVIRPMGVADMLKKQEDEERRLEQVEQARQRRKSSSGWRDKRVRRAVVGGPEIKAEYVVAGDASHPMPQIRLHVSTTAESSRRSSATSMPATSPAITSDEEPDEDDEEADDEGDAPTRSGPFHSAFGDAFTPRAETKVPTLTVIPPSPRLQKIQAAKSPIWALATSGTLEPDMGSLTIGDAAVEELKPSPNAEEPGQPGPERPALEGRRKSSGSERDFIVPLASDQAFFSLLTAALTSLSAFHAAQQAAFTASVEALCKLISQSIQPSDGSISVLPTPLTPSPTTVVTHSSASRSRSSTRDLYAWREIFSLWIEAEIFESSAERNRGERTIEEAEVRLKRFANEVVRRGLGDRRTIKGKKSKEAWGEFLRLNMLLLDLKRFQLANINAARKILKKHDKRTALTASIGFQSFVRSTITSSVDVNGNVSTWTFYNTSLPHVLLASLTDTLLPILPSLDDYACLICTSIAFKPIRLACNHLFCVRCLVKMQRAGKDECPLCRSAVILSADKTSLDLALMNFMKGWFPKEVKAKQKENELEVAQEQARDAGLDTRCVVM